MLWFHFSDAELMPGTCMVEKLSGKEIPKPARTWIEAGADRNLGESTEI